MKAEEMKVGMRVVVDAYGDKLNGEAGTVEMIHGRKACSVQLDGNEKGTLTLIGVRDLSPVPKAQGHGKLKSGIPWEAGAMVDDVTRPIMDDDDAHKADVQKLDKRVSELTEELDKKDQAIRRHLDIAASLRERIEELNATLVSAIDEIVTLNRALRNTVQKVDNETQDQS